ESSPHRITTGMTTRLAIGERHKRVEWGYFARSLNAYGREGEPCARCAGTIRRQMFQGRSTHFCPRCQRKR
ncbi:MAG: hypothetical protein L0K01_04875, partial [Brachybacterium sp.]|nr:hypothetical protein [Brachybacterium sp.]